MKEIPEINRETENIDINNFWMNLPGGYYDRKLYGKDPEVTNLIDAINGLLKEPEFSDIDVPEIIQTVHGKMDGTLENPELKYGEAKKKMQRIFCRLKDLGFEEKMLRR
jgi:hypothetical protein